MMIKIQIRSLNSLSAYITRPHRLTYTRTHPTTLVYPDGSTVTIRYPEPRKIIRVRIMTINYFLFVVFFISFYYTLISYNINEKFLVKCSGAASEGAVPQLGSLIIH